jgi:glucose dehydrogenase
MINNATRRFSVRIRFHWLLVLILAGILLAFFYLWKGNQPIHSSTSDVNWAEYNGGADRNHFSALTQIDTQHIGRLEKVWEYNSGGADTVTNQTQVQCNALIIDGVLFGISASSQAFALDAATGLELWKTIFTDETFAMTSRGVTYWTDGTAKRIFFAYGHWQATIPGYHSFDTYLGALRAYGV